MISTDNISKQFGSDYLDDFTKTVLSTEGVSRSTTHVVLNTVKEIAVTLPPE